MWAVYANEQHQPSLHDACIQISQLLASVPFASVQFLWRQVTAALFHTISLVLLQSHVLGKKKMKRKSVWSTPENGEKVEKKAENLNFNQCVGSKVTEKVTFSLNTSI